VSHSIKRFYKWKYFRFPAERPDTSSRKIWSGDGKGLHMASSPAAMLAALEGLSKVGATAATHNMRLTVLGHESLRRVAGIIQCDISLGNLMMNEDKEDPSWPAF
jgi:hypothetical protein